MRFSLAVAAVVALVAAGPASARPTDVNIVSSPGSFPAAPSTILMNADNLGNGVSVSRAIPAGYDFAAQNVSGYGDSGMVYTVVGEESRDAFAVAVPFDRANSSVFNSPAAVTVRSSISAIALWGSSGSHSLYVWVSGYWISESTGRLAAQPAGF